MKACVVLFAVTMALLACGEKKSKSNEDGGWDITITGRVGFPQKGDSIHIYEMTSEGPGRKESIELKDDYTFTHVLHLREPGYYTLDFYDKQIVTVMLAKSDVDITVDGNNRQGFFDIKGSAEYDLIKKVRDMQGRVQQSSELAKISMLYNQAAAKNDATEMGRLQKIYMDSLKKSNDEIAAFLLAQPASIAVLNVLGDGRLLDKDEYGNVYKDAADKLKAAYPGAGFSAGFVDFVARMSAVNIGSVAPEIALPNPQGQVVKLSSLRGKYVLIDFWAKWCGPCRLENPNVVKAYKRFNSKGFEVFGVSLDRSHEDWVQAIEQDGLVWTQVSDLKHFGSEAAQLYNVNAIPSSFLLDKNGVIITKNLRGPALEEKLEELLGK